MVGTRHGVTEDYTGVSISLTQAKVTTVKFRAGSPKLVLAIETTRTLLLKFPDREPDSGYGELAHISQMSQHMPVRAELVTTNCVASYLKERTIVNTIDFRVVGPRSYMF